MSKVFDCFSYNGEIELLDIRLNYLNDHVDYFVITESNKTFSGKQKKYLLETVKAKKVLRKFKNKLIYLKFENESFNENLAKVKSFREMNHQKQKNYFVQELGKYKENLDEAYFLVNDIDEIPKKELIGMCEHKSTYMPHKLKQSMYHYFFNVKRIDIKFWYGAFICRGYALNKIPPFSIRHVDSLPMIENTGWHFSYLGDEKFIKYKINSLLEVEFNTKENLKNIKNKIDNNLDVLNRQKNKYLDVDFEKEFPDSLKEHLVKYEHFIKKIEK